MIKKYTLLFAAMFFFFGAFAQIENPVQWRYTVKKISSKDYEIHMTANIQPGWHLYAQDAGDGPVATTFEFKRNPLVKTDDGTKEVGKLIKEYDNNFNSVLKFYATKVDFVQKVKLRTAASTTFSGTIEYMVCNDHKCLPPKKVPFSVSIAGK